MLICYRYDPLLLIRQPDAPNSITFGIAFMQWTMPTDADNDDGRRLAVLIPIMDVAKPYCHGHILVRACEQWCFPKGNALNDLNFISPDLPQNHMEEIDEETQQDFYYVWDDGADQHNDRAQRLYATFQGEIEKHSAQALELKEKLFKLRHEEEFRAAKERAKERGWEMPDDDYMRPAGAYGSR